MSKETYIGGDYIETTGGNNLNYAKGNIVNSSLLQVTQKGKENGVTYNLPKQPEDSKVEIEEIYWVYGEKNERIKNYSRYFVDLNLVVKVKNGKPGDFVKILIKSEDGEAISDEIETLSLSGIVLEGSKIIFKEPLKNYSMILMKDEEK